MENVKKKELPKKFLSLNVFVTREKESERNGTVRINEARTSLSTSAHFFYSFRTRLSPLLLTITRRFQHFGEERVDGGVTDQLEKEQVLQTFETDASQRWKA